MLQTFALLRLTLLVMIMMMKMIIIVYVVTVLMCRYEYAKSVLTVHAEYTIDCAHYYLWLTRCLFSFSSLSSFSLLTLFLFVLFFLSIFILPLFVLLFLHLFLAFSSYFLSCFISPLFFSMFRVLSCIPALSVYSPISSLHIFAKASSRLAGIRIRNSDPHLCGSQFLGISPFFLFLPSLPLLLARSGQFGLAPLR